MTFTTLRDTIFGDDYFAYDSVQQQTTEFAGKAWVFPFTVRTPAFRELLEKGRKLPIEIQEENVERFKTRRVSRIQRIKANSMVVTIGNSIFFSR